MSLNRREMIELARAIEERRGALLEEIESDVVRARAEPYAEVAGAVRDIGDEAVADLITDVDQAEVARDIDELRELNAAHRRLADGSYGICMDCGADIGVERLRAQPAAARCVACQRRHEKTYRT
jgi:RNA polymerase-binding transcription factor DksA